jgi:hypothetical protein
MRFVDVLTEKQSLSHLLDFCSDHSTENEVEQEELNTGPNIPYQTCVSIHDGHYHKKWLSHCRCPERETVVLVTFCSDSSTENEVEQEELNTVPTTPYLTFVFIHGEKQSFILFLDCCSDNFTENEVEQE